MNISGRGGVRGVDRGSPSCPSPPCSSSWLCPAASSAGKRGELGGDPPPPPFRCARPPAGSCCASKQGTRGPTPLYSGPIVLPQVRALALSEAAPRPAISQMGLTQKQLRAAGPKLPVVPRPRTTPRPHPCARDTTGGAHPHTCPCGTQPGVSITIIKWVR
jgi:hypothetical protein